MRRCKVAATSAGDLGLIDDLDQFGDAGLAVWVAGLLMRSSPRFSRGFTALTFLLGALLIVVYLGRLIVLTPSSSLVLIPAAVTGFIVNPLWYLFLGLSLRRDEAIWPSGEPVAAESSHL